MTKVHAHRRWRLLFGALALIVFGAACAWAVLTVVKPPEDPLVSTEHTYAEVSPGEVGASISLNTVAKWTQVPVGSNLASGIVTSVELEAGAAAAQGSVLYSVNLRPVAVAQGDVPMFRQISAGVEGRDVEQLQSMLASLGYYHYAIDGEAGPGTVAAIKSWQEASNIEDTGVVETGDVIFVPLLPGRLALDSEIVHRGARVSGGESAVLGLSTAPEFSVPVAEGQAAMMPAGTIVEVSSPDGQVWEGVTGDQERDPDSGTITVALKGPNDTLLCGDGCGQVPVSGETLLESTVVTVEQVAGLVVPSSALVTTANGATAVIDPEGERIQVEVIASARGMSVVSGIDAGTRVQVPASAQVE